MPPKRSARLPVSTPLPAGTRGPQRRSSPPMSSAQYDHHRRTLTQRNCRFPDRCRYGTQCKFHHQQPNWPACTGVQVARVRFTCCVCGSGPQSDPHFCYGVLDCCDHPICYDCAKPRRGQKSLSLICPRCQKPIKYFFRSSRRLVGQERELAKRLTLATWSNTPCRSYVAKGWCPHRNQCHFKHPHPRTGKDLRPTEEEPSYIYDGAVRGEPNYTRFSPQHAGPRFSNAHTASTRLCPEHRRLGPIIQEDRSLAFAVPTSSEDGGDSTYPWEMLRDADDDDNYHDDSWDYDMRYHTGGFMDFDDYMSL